MTMQPPPFTLNDLLAFLREDEEKRGYLTSREWARHFDLPHKKMMRLLHEADDKGILRKGRADRSRLDGPIQPVPVYAFDIADEDEGE